MQSHKCQWHLGSGSWTCMNSLRCTNHGGVVPHSIDLWLFSVLACTFLGFFVWDKMGTWEVDLRVAMMLDSLLMWSDSWGESWKVIRSLPAFWNVELGHWWRGSVCRTCWNKELVKWTEGFKRRWLLEWHTKELLQSHYCIEVVVWCCLYNWC